MKKGIRKSINFIKKYWFSILLILLALGAFVVYSLSYLYKLYKVNKDFSKLDLDGYNKLMIVAHPDDEMLWGGAHLIEDNYLVVCVTCGGEKERVNEFTSVMHATNDRFIMLGYPDKTNGERDNWDSVREDIIKDVEDIINLKEWEIIVTHNPQGEYGHIHHKMTSAITTDIVKDKTKLYYFGRYHSKKKISEYYNTMSPINDKYLKEKKDILGLYRSQFFIQTIFDHMFAYEDWESFEEWSRVE